MAHSTPASVEDPREQALALLRRFGRNSTSFQALEPGLRYWLSTAGDACIAYAESRGAWVVAGAPIAASGDLRTAAEQFAEEARRERKRVCFFAVEERFLQAVGWPALPIGEQPVWDPAGWGAIVASSRSLREQLRRARAKGVSVRRAGPEELAFAEAPLRRDIVRLVSLWLRSRRMARMGFLVQVDLFSFAEERGVFAAEREGELVGFLAMVPVYARGGWLLEDLVLAPHAPNGTAELLVDAAMVFAAEAGSRYATLGLAPLAGEVHPWLRALKRAGSRLYNFEGLRAFKAKFRPDRWDPIFLSHPPGQNRALTVLDAVSAFASGGLLRFGLATLMRNPELPLRLLTLLLMPWTLLLATADPAWFPAAWVRTAWTAFDSALLPALALLGRRWRQWLGLTLAVLISADSLLTLAEVLAFNLRPPASALSWVVSAVAVLGPSLASLFLWSAWSCRRRILDQSGGGSNGGFW